MMNGGGLPLRLRPLAHAVERMSKGRLQKGVVLGVAAAAIGILTTLSGVVIELASDILADLRHGVCVERLPGDTRPLWHATFGGGWRPYDRMRCCGGSSLVDHATEECRALSIIQHSTRKRIAYPLPFVGAFGRQAMTALGPEGRWLALSMTAAKSGARASMGEGQEMGALSARAIEVGGSLGTTAGDRSRGHAARAAHLKELVGRDAERVRGHISHLFGPDPAERWAEEAATAGESDGGHRSSLAEEVVEVAVNEGVVQTQSESAGSLAPVYEWVPWERALMTRGHASALVIYVVGSGLFAMLAALVTRGHPAAKGSGIPEVKASVAGFALPRSFSAQTLAAKVSALSLCVGAGLAVGKEGPMIHIGACWGVLLSGPLSRLVRCGTPIIETDLVCVGAAAGVAAAFGAPLAGVLFAVEELGTTLPTGLRYSTMLCAFGSAVVAALTLKWLDLTRTQRLTLFEVDYKQAWAPWEAIPFCLLGVAGGVLGAAFVRANEAIHRRRLSGQAGGRPCWCLPGLGNGLGRLIGAPLGADPRVLEVVLLAVLTCISNYPHMLTRMLQNDAITALFSQCPVAAATGSRRAVHDPVGLCSSEEDAAAVFGLLRLLLGAAALRFLQTTVTFGALTPAGLFVPSLFMGGCVGRAVGALLRVAKLPGAQGVVEPGIYAMVGAGAMLAGVSRLTVSLAVVLFELTGGLTYVVPFMLAVLTAKWTGDFLTNGRSVYDVHAELNGFAKVEPSEDVRLLNATLQDLCVTSAGVGAEANEAGVGSPPALWVSSGRCWSSDLAAHCCAAGAGAGFAVLSVGAGEEVCLLGWARSSCVLARLAALNGKAPAGQQDAGGDAAAAAERWCLLSASASPRAQRSSPAEAPGVEDFSDVIETRGVIRVRSDCPLQTALCIFQTCPAVSAVVSVDGVPLAARTVTRELFMHQLLHGSLCAVQPMGPPSQAVLAVPASKLAAADGLAVLPNLLKAPAFFGRHPLASAGPRQGNALP